MVSDRSSLMVKNLSMLTALWTMVSVLIAARLVVVFTAIICGT